MPHVPPYLTPVWTRCLETHAALLDCLAQFPEERFTWRPAPNARSAAEILAHIARGDCTYARCIHPHAPTPPLLADPGTEEAALPEALVPGDRASALQVIEAGFNYATAVVSQATEADLEREVADDWAPLGPLVQGPLTGLWFIEQMNRHKAYHLGQLWYLITMLAEPPAEP